MLAHGFTLRMLAGLVRVGLAREQRGVFEAGGKTIKIVRVEITAAGRRAIEVDRALWRQRRKQRSHDGLEVQSVLF